MRYPSRLDFGILRLLRSSAYVSAGAVAFVAATAGVRAATDCDAERARMGAPAVALYTRANALGETAQKTAEAKTYRQSSDLFVRILAVAEAKHVRADCLASMYENASFVAYQSGRPQLGLREVRRDLALQPAGAPVQDRAEKQAFLGLELAAAGRLDEAIGAERASLALFESEPKPDPADLVAIRYALGTALLRTGRYDDATSALQPVVELAPSGATTVQALTLVSSAQRSAGRVADADRSLDAAFAAAGDDAAQKALVLLWRSQARIQSGRYAEAETDLHAIVDAKPDSSPASASVRAAADGALGGLLLGENRIAESKAAYDAARSLLSSLPAATIDLQGTAMAEEQADLLLRAGRYADARQIVARERPRAARASEVLYAGFGGGNPTTAELDMIDGAAALGERRYVEGEAAFDRALRSMSSVSRTSALGATAVLNRSTAKRLLGQFRAARTDLYAAHGMLGSAPNDGLAAEFDFNRAVLDYYAHSDRDGSAAFAAAFEDLKREYATVFAALGERERLAFAAQTERVFDAYFTFALERPHLAGTGAAAFDLALFRKGLVARSIAALQARARRSSDPAVAKDLDDLVAVKKELAALGARPGAPDRTVRASELQSRGSAIQVDLAARLTDVAAAIAIRAPHASDVRATLRPDEAAVEIVRFRRITNRDTTGPPWYAAVVLRADRAEPFVVELGSAEAIEGPALAAFRQIGVAPEARRMSSDAHALSRLVWQPIANAVVGVRTIYLSGDGVLATVAFDAMQDADGSLVADRKDGRVVLVDSASDLGIAQTATANTALLFGDPRFDLSEADQRVAVARLLGGSSPSAKTLAADTPSIDGRFVAVRSASDGAGLAPLPDTGDEVRGIARQLRAHHWDVRTYTGADALQEALETQAHDRRVVHLATHGVFLPDVDTPQLPATLPIASGGKLLGAGGAIGPGEPPPPLPDAVVGSPENDPMLRSLLFFAGADRAWAKREAPSPGLDSEVMTAAEVSTLDLRGTELVVLSACDTGLGSVRSGDGVIGLRRALRQAGARAVLMSLWPLPDRETGELMSAFYDRWLGGSEAHEALRAAQHDERAIVLKRYGTADPYYWAGLILVGPPSRS